MALAAAVDYIRGLANRVGYSAILRILFHKCKTAPRKPNARLLLLICSPLSEESGLAFEGVGGKCVYSSELDRDCQTTYSANFGEVPDGDITQVDAGSIPDHDILTGGFPCQSFSIIGKRMGVRDTRGTLFFEVERILKAKHPHAFLLENVKQLVTIDKGETFALMLARLRDLGYFVHWKVLDALDYDIPQKRERVIIVGFKKNYPFEFPRKVESRRSLEEEILGPEHAVHQRHLISERVALKLKSKVTATYEHARIWHENKSGNIGIHEYSCALRANASYDYLLVNGKRRLTPRENLRLMGFPESFKVVVPDWAVRRQAGNSVVIPVIQAVAQEMVEAMRQAPLLPLRVSQDRLPGLAEGSPVFKRAS